jgi:thioredoxin
MPSRTAQPPGRHANDPASAAKNTVIDRALDTGPDMASRIPLIDLAAFDALDAGAPDPGVTVVDFTAKWCGPCRTLDAVLGALADEYAGRVQFVAVDVNEEPALADRFGVRAMPTLVVWRGGREVGRVVGSRPRAFVAGVLERALVGDVAIAGP